MSDYQLGDRVTMTGTAQKKKRFDSPNGGKLMTVFEDGPTPKIWNREGGTDYTEGVVVGRRFVQEGRTEFLDYDGTRVFKSSGITHRVWIVAFDLRYKPVMCFDHQISKEAEK